MGKKKPFIDKKNASTFHLLHRSQRDVAGDGSGVVLWPNPENNQETNDKVLQGDVAHLNNLEHWRNQMAEVGLVDDYDYDQHMKQITGTGDFFGKDGHRGDALNDVRAQHLEENVQEVERQLDSIALTPECMDEDIAQALFGDFEEGDFEEILDDFCLTAAQDPEEEEEEFDFDKHVQQLLEKARLKKEEKGIDPQHHAWGRQDQNFFSNVKALHERDEDDDSGHYSSDDEDGGDPGVVPALNPDEEKALCEKFEQTLLEYDSDEYGELEDEEIGGDRPLEGDIQLEAALDEYLEVKEDDIFIEGTRHLPEYNRGNGFHTIQRESEPEDMEKVLKEANDFLRSPELVLPPEDVLIDGKSYFSQASRNPWDCESVLSTYSNVDNNPAVIDSGRRQNKKKKSKAIPEAVPEEEEPVRIMLSNKTGLPLGVLPSKQKEDNFDFDTIASVNKGEKRSKEESASQKKNRKQLVKQERQISRIQKKMMREAFRDEFTKREGDVAGDDIAGKSVFRF